MSKWEMMPVLEVLSKTITGEWGNEPVEGTRGTKVLRTTNFINNGCINYNNVVERNIPLDKVKKKKLENDDIILEKSGGSENQPVGRVVYFSKENDEVFLCNNFTQILRVDREIAFSKYIFLYLFYLHKNGVTELLQNKTTGIRNLQVKRYMNLEIPLPPLNIQKKIATALDSANALIEKRKEQIEKLDLLIKSQFIEMFGDPVTNPKGWYEEKLCDLGDLGRGVSKHRPRNDSKLLGGIYPLIQTGDVASAGLYIKDYHNTYNEIGLAQSKLWEKGTLCITIAANIAKTGILAFDACFPDSIVGFLANSNKTNNIFMFYWFKFFQKILENQAPESAQKNINLKILRDLDIIYPPYSLQIKFAEFVEKVEAQKVLLKKSLADMEQNYQSLMQKCFKGEIF